MDDTITISRAEYDRLLEAADDLANIQAYDRAMARNEASIPAEYVKRLIDGESPLRVYRDMRGLTQMALAEMASVNRVQITDIEAGRQTGSVSTLKKLAGALGLTVDDLV